MYICYRDGVLTRVSLLYVTQYPQTSTVLHVSPTPRFSFILLRRGKNKALRKPWTFLWSNRYSTDLTLYFLLLFCLRPFVGWGGRGIKQRRMSSQRRAWRPLSLRGMRENSRRRSSTCLLGREKGRRASRTMLQSDYDLFFVFVFLYLF